MIIYNGQIILLKDETPTMDDSKFVYTVKSLSEPYMKGNIES